MTNPTLMLPGSTGSSPITTITGKTYTDVLCGAFAKTIKADFPQVELAGRLMPFPLFWGPAQ